MRHAAAGDSSGAVERSLPPVTEIAIGTLVLIVIGAIDLSAQIPGHPALAPAVVLLALAAALLIANLLLLRRLRVFAWRSFFQVYGWTQLAFAITAGMIAYTFIIDGAGGRALVVLLLMLLVYAIDIPLLLAFAVARYQEVGSAGTA